MRLSNLAPKTFRVDDNEFVEDVGSKANGTIKNSSKSKKLKNNKSENSTRIEAMEEPIFLTPGAKEAFNHLRQVFIKAPILQHFNLEYHI